MATSTAPQTNGRAAPAKFQPGWEPEQIALRTIPGKAVTGFNGDQVLFHLTNGRPWYADLYVGRMIEDMRLQPGEVFAVNKRKIDRGGRSIVEVEITAVAEPEPAASSCQSPAAGTNQGTANYHQTNGTPQPLPPAPAVPAPMNSHGETSKMHLTRCYQDAVDIAMAAVAYAKDRGLMIAPEFADLRCLAATIAIQEGNRR